MSFIKLEQLSRDAVLLMPDGSIDINNSKEYKETFLDLFNKGVRIITIDFSNVTFVDASGLAKLLFMQKLLKEQQGKLRIVNINSSPVALMFERIHLGKVIEIQSDAFKEDE